MILDNNTVQIHSGKQYLHIEEMFLQQFTKIVNFILAISRRDYFTIVKKRYRIRRNTIVHKKMTLHHIQAQRHG